MANLYVVRGKVNPIGKDRRGLLTPPKQLHAEWVDVKNTSGVNLQMLGTKIADHTFNGLCNYQGKRIVYAFPNWIMPAGTTVRIHSGDTVPVNLLPPQDRDGADWHAFTGRDYVWNNVCGDTVEIVTGDLNVLLDKASYDPRPKEGAILVRLGNKLIPIQ
ncbi:MAG: hypothetical protein A2593_00185 [Candidatus Moranbacteria bacterium RIFOXYD1_FULL_44_9]|nr:MAG: hypothetical protein A2593_00185 [Candidatus Moranbacteria bacterium RIFOXYD1_FULL_44_9]